MDDQKDNQNIVNRNIVAIAYDFDGTLIYSNMLEQAIFSKLGLKGKKWLQDNPGSKEKTFWDECKEHAKEHNMDEILAYMHLLLIKVKGKITRSFLEECGSELKFFPGVDSWFDRINQFAQNKGIILQHYVISSGLQAMIANCEIKNYFEYVWACDFVYDDDWKPIWPSLVVNYTTKTQYLFRINKGEHAPYENNINEFMPDHKRPVPFSNMIFIGDGATDVPSMKMTMHQGGKSIAVYDPDSKYDDPKSGKKSSALLCKDLQLQGRVNDYAPADYNEDRPLNLIIKEILEHIAKNYIQ